MVRLRIAQYVGYLWGLEYILVLISEMKKNVFAERYEGIRGNFTIQTGEYYLRDQLLQV